MRPQVPWPWAAARRAPAAGPWRCVLLVLHPDDAGIPLAGLEVACRLVPPGGVLHALAPVCLPLAVALEAPAGEETVPAADLLEQVERLAGERGVAVQAALARGRAVRSMVREAIGRTGADLVVLEGGVERLALLAQEPLPAQTVLVPRRREGI